MTTPKQAIRAVQSRGALIMQVAEAIRPYLMEKLMGCRDENGLPLQPARVRAVALNAAQAWVKYYQSTLGEA